VKEFHSAARPLFIRDKITIKKTNVPFLRISAQIFA
jgi:hypothetical protein